MILYNFDLPNYRALHTHTNTHTYIYYITLKCLVYYICIYFLKLINYISYFRKRYDDDDGKVANLVEVEVTSVVIYKK